MLIVGCRVSSPEPAATRTPLSELVSTETPSSTAPPAVLEHIRRLEDEEPSVRVSAVWALGEIGPEAAEVVPALLAALRDDEDLWMSRLVAQALMAVASERSAASRKAPGEPANESQFTEGRV
jgi:hypothetical protein